MESVGASSSQELVSGRLVDTNVVWLNCDLGNLAVFSENSISLSSNVTHDLGCVKGDIPSCGEFTSGVADES